METTEKKKHKSGFALLKEKLVKAEAKNAELQKEKEILVQTAQDNYCRVEKERDEWKAKYKQKFRECIELQNNKVNSHDDLMNVMRERDKWREECQKCIDRDKSLKSRIAFLLKHCPFWVRWKYRKQFEKGGN